MPTRSSIGAATRALVASAATLEPLPNVAAKGKRDAVPAWRVVAVDDDAPGIARRLDSPLVDRVEELERLRDVVGRAETERRAVVATVVGAAGVGKSRLVHELLDGLAGRATVLSGRCVAYGGTTYRPLVEILRNAGGPEAVTRALAGEDNEQLLAERLEAAGGLSSATFTTDEIFWAVRRFVELNARERPVVLVVDDAHWAEPTFHDLIDYLAAFVTQAPVSLIRLGRPELLDQRPGPTGTRDDRARAARGDRRGGAARRSGSAEARAGGDHGGRRGEPAVPRAARRRRRRRGAGRASHSADDRGSDRRSARPASRRELALLECASVIGRRFDLRALVELVRPDDSLDAISSLVALTRAGLVRPAPGPAGEDRYAFAHGLVRDAAYARIPKTQRADLHEALARRLLADTARTPAADDLAGHHLEQACRALRAAGPGRRARARARRGGRSPARDRGSPGGGARRRSGSDRPPRTCRRSS